MPSLWTFRYYVDERGNSDVRETYETGSSELRSKTLSRLKILASLPRREWHENYHKQLSGPYDGLCELRFKANKVQQRILGVHLEANEFLILFWATEKGNKFVPKNACENALRRLKNIQEGKDRADELWLTLE